MRTTTPYLDGVLQAIDVVAGRFAALVTAAPDPAVQVPSSPGWTVRDVAAHVATVAVRYADGPEGRGIWTETPAGLPAHTGSLTNGLGTSDHLSQGPQRHESARFETRQNAVHCVGHRSRSSAKTTLLATSCSVDA